MGEQQVATTATKELPSHSNTSSSPLTQPTSRAMTSRIPRGPRLWDKGRGWGGVRCKEEVLCRKREEAAQ